MIFYIYSEEIEKLSNISNLIQWFESQFRKIGLNQIHISLQNNPFEGNEYISIYQEGKWSLSVRLEMNSDTVKSNQYYAKYLPVEDELKNVLSNSKSRLFISIHAVDKMSPEDTVDAIRVLEELPNSKMFGPLEYHRKKMEAFPNQITKNKVSKNIELVMEKVLKNHGFTKEDKLLFRKADDQIVEVVFYNPSQLEESLCTKASFCLYKSNGVIHKEVTTKEGFITWYVEPDGSNLDEIINEFESTLFQVNDSWFELVY